MVVSEQLTVRALENGLKTNVIGTYSAHARTSPFAVHLAFGSLVGDKPGAWISAEMV